MGLNVGAWWQWRWFVIAFFITWFDRCLALSCRLGIGGQQPSCFQMLMLPFLWCFICCACDSGRSGFSRTVDVFGLGQVENCTPNYTAIAVWSETHTLALGQLWWTGWAPSDQRISTGYGSPVWLVGRFLFPSARCLSRHGGIATTQPWLLIAVGISYFLRRFFFSAGTRSIGRQYRVPSNAVASKSNHQWNESD